MSHFISERLIIDVMGEVGGVQGNEDKSTQVYGGKSFKKETPYMSQM
jgi:hypothetical protein